MRVKVIFLVHVLATLFISCDTQKSFETPDENYFVKYFGNEGNQQGVDFAVNDDGTVFILGNSRASSSNQQIYVARVGVNGRIVWEKTFGLSLDEEAKDIEISFDKSSLIVVGNSEKSVGERDIFLIRLTLDGVAIDSTRQGLKLPSGQEADDNAFSVTQINQGLFNPAGFIVAGATTGLNFATIATDKTDPMHLRFNNNLVRISNPTWSDRPTFTTGGFVGEEVAVKVIQRSSNDYYVFGYSNGGDGDFNFLRYGRTDLGGEFGSPRNTDIGISNADEKLNSVSISPAQLGLGFMLSGISQTSSGGYSYLVKLGSPLSWNDSDVTFRQILPLDKAAKQRSVNYSSLTNGYFVASDKAGANGTDIYLVKLDNAGKKLFESEFGGVGDDFVGAVTELPNGRILIIGTMTLGGVEGQTKIALLKLNPEGRLAP
ncbi:MAG: hypothetical protein IM606_09705 [Cytophagales bacterium]|jgi:hypothetical protein|nr:hypothetical protein [Cytophagales bacterium]MCA6389484.1 hypothetical protein [Cytophagales bacterium]MCA6393189.1 hypothetical protein [Cytophagales bacterium]MCA6395451.1 hypothetical protein [Cytophagales bacterium]MCA6400044.1 hypothetical protein [Cytophagales bacterium]